MSAVTTAPAPITASRPIRTPSATTTCAPSQALSSTSTDEIGVGRDQYLPSNPDFRRREHLDVEAHVGAVLENDVAVLATEDRAAAEEHALAYRDADIRRAFCIQAAVVVDDHVVANLDLVGMTQYDVRTKRDVAAHASENHRIELGAQEQAQRPRHPRRAQHRQLVADERPQAGLPDDEIRVPLAARPAGPILALNVGDARIPGGLPSRRGRLGTRLS